MTARIFSFGTGRTDTNPSTFKTAQTGDSEQDHSQHTPTSTTESCPSLSKDHAMVLYWDGTRFPRRLLRSSEENLCRGDGLVRPRLLNLGSILGVGVWKGLPQKHKSDMTPPALTSKPSCGADIIVSILYRHSPTTLSDLFAASDFEFAHSNGSLNSSQFQEFAIGRKGNLVKAGFLKKIVVSGVVTQQWTSFVEYELLESPSNHELWWRQLTLKEQHDPVQDQRDVPDLLLDRAIWELDAVTILARALTERRWRERPGGFRVNVDKITKSEKLDQAERSMSEVDYNAEGEAASGDSSPTALDMAVSNEHAAVVIPGTEDFDDVGVLLRAAEAEKKTRYGRLSNGHRVGKMAPGTSQA